MERLAEWPEQAWAGGGRVGSDDRNRTGNLAEGPRVPVKPQKGTLTP